MFFILHCFIIAIFYLQLQQVFFVFCITFYYCNIYFKFFIIGMFLFLLWRYDPDKKTIMICLSLVCLSVSLRPGGLVCPALTVRRPQLLSGDVMQRESRSATPADSTWNSTGWDKAIIILLYPLAIQMYIFLCQNHAPEHMNWKRERL